MKNEKDFYDIIRSKSNERETPFDEENWASMREMIDASRTSQKRVLWLVASLALLLSAGGAVGIYYTGHSANTNSNSITNTPLSNSQGTIANNTKQNPNATVPVIETEQNKTKSNSSTSTTIKNTNADGKQIQSNGNPINLTASNNPTYTKSIKNNGHLANPNNNVIASVNGRTSAGPNAASPSEIKNSNNPNNSTIESTNQNNLTTNKTATTNTASSSTTPKTPTSPLTVKAATSVTKTNSHRPDTIAAAADALPKRFSDEPRVFQGKTNLFSVDADIEYSGGWEIGSVDQGKGFNFGIGMGYSHYIGSGLFIKTGLQFSTFGNMSPLTYNYQHSVGNVIYDSVITTQRLYFIKVPIQAEFFVGRSKKSSIGVGGSIWYLVGNSGFATTYQQTDNNPPVNVQTYSKNAPLDGYNKINVSAHLLYRYVFSNKLSMYVVTYFEITNMKNNAFFGENIVERTRGFQFMLSYNL